MLREGNMAVDAADILNKLKALRTKLPAKLPDGLNQLEKDYPAFLKKADFFVVVLKRFAEDAPDSKDLAEFKAKQDALAKLQTEIAKLKTKINNAAKEQASDQQDVIQVLRDVLKMNDDMQDELKGNKDKAAIDLGKAVYNFSLEVEMATGLKAAEPISD
jgi:citrate synthase